MVSAKQDLLISPQDYFTELVEEALASRKLGPVPMISKYLSNLLQFYLPAENMVLKGKDEEREPTLAEIYLRASSAEGYQEKMELYKRLGDSTLYISGFFGDSLKRKIVDVDYYAGLGGSAYGHLAQLTNDDPFLEVYEAFSQSFLTYAEVLTYVSQRTLIQSNEDLLRLYELYLHTGSDLARDQLIEKGLIAPSGSATKSKIAQ